MKFCNLEYLLQLRVNFKNQEWAFRIKSELLESGVSYWNSGACLKDKDCHLEFGEHFWATVRATHDPPPNRWSWSTITEAWPKIQKSCWKFSRSSLKYDAASLIWWSELKIYGEQGQIKELSLKYKRRVQKHFPVMRSLREECKILNSAIKFK